MRAPLAVMLLTSLLAPAAVYANSDSTPSASAVRVTTGVIPPAVLNSANFSVTSDALSGVGLERPAVVLALTVDEKGSTQNVRVIRSVNPKVDAQVLAGVRDFKFRPATLDHQPVSVDLDLTVVVQR